ncbi:MAG: cell wall hydrolase [Sphingomonadales bacterium]
MPQHGLPITKLAVLGLYVIPLCLPFVLPELSREPVAEQPVPQNDARETAVEPIATIDNTVLAAIDVPTDDLPNHQKCLAQAVYFEARSEPPEGQVAVAQVILNRVKSPRYPSTICAVVFQNEWWRHRCQFSFACDGRSDNPKEQAAWERSKRVALLVLTANVEDFSAAATHYHANYVKPYWADRLQATAHLGRHVFYRE